MARRRLVLVLALAMGMGLITGIAVYRSVKTARDPQGGLEDIVVAVANIGLGEVLTAKHVKANAWPKSALPPGFLRSVKEAEGRVARTSIVTGEPVLDSKLASVGPGGLMPVLVPSGKRALTIKVDEAVQKAGFVVPNSRVDVLVTMARRGGESKEARTVLQDVTVLASDQTVELKDNRPVTMTTVTLALSPEEAERLALAQNEGKVMLAIRNLHDAQRVSTPGVSTEQLLGTPEKGPAHEKRAAVVAERPTPRRRVAPERIPASLPAQSPPQTYTVSVIRGVSLTDYLFVRDPDLGWVETPSKTKAAEKPG